jgi:ribonucleoside-diphosphate reductase alpha chain
MSSEPIVPVSQPFRHRLASERSSVTHKFSIAGHEGYVIVGLYDDGQPGEIFLHMAKEGSTVSGLMDAFAIATSLALQYGVPLKVLCKKFIHTRFEPSGYTLNPEIRHAKSVMDYIFRWLALKFLPPTEEIKEAGIPPDAANPAPTQLGVVKIRQSDPPERVWLVPLQPTVAGVEQPSDAPSCQDCGAIMVRSGACYKCMNCGSTSGCS